MQQQVHGQSRILCSLRPLPPAVCSASRSVRYRHTACYQQQRQRPSRPATSQQAAIQSGQTSTVASSPFESPASHATADNHPGDAVEAVQQGSKQFDWYKAWYPLAVLTDLDPDIPSPAKLLGIDLAIWFDRNAGEWRVFQDRCPHRLGPLSEGRIDHHTGNLYCNYHGWQFDGSGSCAHIPQLQPGRDFNTRRSCATSFPTCAREGLLWVWPDSSITAKAESSSPENWPGLAPELDHNGTTGSSTGWYFRELPVCWLAMKENAFNDCSHDTVLHHGTNVFLRRENAGPVDMRLVEMTPTGYTVREASGRFEDVARFPCGSMRRGFLKGVVYIVPTDVGKCRYFSTLFPPKPNARPKQQQQQQQTVRDRPGSSDGSSTSESSTGSSSKGHFLKQSAPSLSRVLALQTLLRMFKPTWASHMTTHSLVDADIAIQAKIDAQRAADDRMYTPAAADAAPAAFTKWLQQYGDTGPPVAKLHDPFVGQPNSVPTARQQLLDRYQSHTVHCKACRTAYQRFQALQQVVGVSAVVMASAAVAVAALLGAGALPAGTVPGIQRSLMGLPSGGALAALGLSVAASVAGGVWAVVGRVVKGFIFVDYDKHHVSKL